MKKVLVLVVIAMVGLGVYRWRSGDARVVNHDPALVKDRIWIDHMPRNDRDTIQVFAALSEDPIGIFQATSAWKGQFEIFRYESQGDEFRIIYPQNGEHEKVRAKATRCDKQGMDYCLEISGSSRGVKQYYSQEGWEIGSIRDLDALKAKLLK